MTMHPSAPRFHMGQGQVLLHTALGLCMQHHGCAHSVSVAAQRSQMSRGSRPQRRATYAASAQCSAAARRSTSAATCPRAHESGFNAHAHGSGFRYGTCGRGGPESESEHMLPLPAVERDADAQSCRHTAFIPFSRPVTTPTRVSTFRQFPGHLGPPGVGACSTSPTISSPTHNLQPTFSSVARSSRDAGTRLLSSTCTSSARRAKSCMRARSAPSSADAPSAALPARLQW